MTAHPETRGGRQTRVNQATIEHLNLDGPFDTSEGLKVEDVVICCCACNSSRGTKRLLDWFKSDYCVSRHINEDTVAEPVKKYLRELPLELENFINNLHWTFAKTYANTWPHEYIVQEQVDGALFLALARLINVRGHEGKFYETKQIYFDHGKHTYWHMGNIINRCLKSETFEGRPAENRLP